MSHMSNTPVPIPLVIPWDMNTMAFYQHDMTHTFRRYFKDGGIPDELDVISFDDYYLTVAEHRAFYEESIYPLLKSHQSVWLVPGAYATDGNSSWIEHSPWCCGGSTVADCDACMVNRTNE